jgi:KipI family sensor histidine kinase inhibitor
VARGTLRVVSHDYGDAGILVDLVADDYEQRWAAAQAVGQALRENPPPGFLDVVASYENVFVGFDPLVTDHAAIRAVVEEMLEHPGQRPAPRRFVVPVVYGGEHGPCLDDVAELVGLTPDEVVELHSSDEWVVRFVGSPVGAPMMDGPRLPRSVPRLATPSARMAPGSVAVSGFQSMVYNAPSPGGWRVVGRTPALMFDLATPPHVVYRPGDRFRFRAIDASAWDDWVRPLEEASP